jgi:peptide/nickel transport system permease protein
MDELRTSAPAAGAWRMVRAIALRMSRCLLVVWGAFTATFLALYVLPGNPVEIMYVGAGSPTQVSPAQLDQLSRQLGLDKPVSIQYLDMLTRAAHLNFGVSVQTRQPVAAMIGAALPNTLDVAGFALLAGLAGGIAVAVAAVLIPAERLRAVFDFLPILGLSVAGFLIALALQQVFSFTLGWLPGFGSGTPTSVVLPGLTLAIPLAAVVALLLTGSLRTALASEWADTARATGASEFSVLFTHALRNALPALIAELGVLIGGLLGGAVVVETVFARNGLGQMLVTAVSNKDFPVVLALTVLSAIVFAVTSLVSDALHVAIDPRLRRSDSIILGDPT